MATKPFHYQDPFPMSKDNTEYYLLTKDYVSVSEFEGKEILKVAPEGLTLMAQTAFRDVEFLLRPEHQKQVASILSDPKRATTINMLPSPSCGMPRSRQGHSPFLPGYRYGHHHGQEGEPGMDRAATMRRHSPAGVYNTFVNENLRYSQNAPSNMYDEVNTGTNLPAQIDSMRSRGTSTNSSVSPKGGGSANKTYLYQETKALLTPGKLEAFLIEKMKSLGTAACPPYHLAFVIGGTSAEANLKTVKLASTKYYDNLPTEGNEYGQAFRDLELEAKLKDASEKLGLGAQFGGKYFAHDVRVIRLPRHGASCPVGMGVSCSADRNIKAKINKDGIWIEKLEDNPARLIPESMQAVKAA